MGVGLNGELAFSNGIPDLNVLISSTASNLPVVGGEGDRERVSGVADESSAADTLA